jgi:hypothetical protein
VRRRPLTRAGRREDLQADAVGVVEEEPAGVGPLAMGHDATMVDDRAPRLQPLLGGPHLLDRVHPKREMVQPRSVRRRAPAALRPEGEEEDAVLGQKGVLPPRLR